MELNSYYPCEIFETAEQKTLSFKTDDNVSYHIYFQPIDYSDKFPLSRNIFEFGFEKINLSEKTNGFDIKIRNTVIKVLKSFFSENKDKVIIFYADFSDKRQKYRQFLFYKWKKYYDKQDEFSLFTVEIEDNFTTHFISMILRKDNPYNADYRDYLLKNIKNDYSK